MVWFFLIYFIYLFLTTILNKDQKFHIHPLCLSGLAQPTCRKQKCLAESLPLSLESQRYLNINNITWIFISCSDNIVISQALGCRNGRLILPLSFAHQRKSNNSMALKNASNWPKYRIHKQTERCVYLAGGCGAGTAVRARPWGQRPGTPLRRSDSAESSGKGNALLRDF